MSSLSGLGLTGGAALGVEQPAETRAAIEIVKTDGELRVQEPGGAQSHLLEDQHCKPCVSAFDFLKKQYEAGKDKDGLFELAIEQTNRSQRVLGTVAQPGAGPLEGLTATGDIRATEPAVNAGRVRPDSVRLSSRARMGRRNGLAVETVRPGQVELASQADNAASAPPQSNKAAPTEVAHSDNDGHGHGESVQTSEGGAQGASAVKQSPGQKADSGQHDDEKTGRSNHAGHDESLSTEDQQRVAELAQRDAEVRAHEQAHKSAAGGHGGAISLSYETGPDGKRYAVAGEVPVDISPIKGDPSATIQKMQTIQRAALAPAEPSSADRRVAARAAQYANQARVELQLEQREKSAPTKASKASSDGNRASDDAQAVQEVSPSESGEEGATQEVASSEAKPVQTGAATTSTAGAIGSAVLENSPDSLSQPESAKEMQRGDSAFVSGESAQASKADETADKPNALAAAYGRQGGAVAAVVQPARLSVFG
ncbi:MAG: putative metalloprotease CJM1_0395 family protein [Bradymonadia bacterium]